MNSPFSSGYRTTFDSFANNYWTKIAWGAVFGLFIAWGLAWVLRHAFGQPDEPGFNAGAGPYAKGNRTVDPEIRQTGAGVPGTTTAGTTAAGTTTAADPAYTDQPGRLGGGGLFDFYTRTHRSNEMLRDALLMLLAVMTLNTVARGITRAAAILGWLFFSFAVLFAIFEGAFAHRFARFFYSLIFFGLALALGACAFSYGF